MRTRKDGEATRESILEAAAQVFGGRGFHKATHAEISRAAHVNSALINFHFGSKDDLYRAVWERVSKRVDELYPMDGGTSAGAPAEERLRGHISSLMNIALDPRLEGFHRILAMEMISPTGLLDKALAKHMQEHRALVLGLMRDLLGPSASERTLELCEMCVMSQCRIVLPPPSGRCRRIHHRFKHADAESLAEHITRFSLAGISAVRLQMEASGSERQLSAKGIEQ